MFPLVSLFSPRNLFFLCSSVWKRAPFTRRFEPELQQGLIEHRRLMKGEEDLFSRQQFICVCVFVPPSSVLQISQLCAELKGVESTLNTPISYLRFVPPVHTRTHKSVSLSLFPSLDLSSSHPPSLSPPVFPTLSPETRSSLSTLLSLFKLWTSQQNKSCSSIAPHERTPPSSVFARQPTWVAFFERVSFPVRGCGWWACTVE